MNNGRTQVNGPENNKVDGKVQGLTFVKSQIDCMCQEKKVEENPPALKIAEMHQ